MNKVPQTDQVTTTTNIKNNKRESQTRVGTPMGTVQITESEHQYDGQEKYSARNNLDSMEMQNNAKQLQSAVRKNIDTGTSQDNFYSNGKQSYAGQQPASNQNSQRQLQFGGPITGFSGGEYNQRQHQ